MPSCASSIQPRRRPSSRPNNGSGIRSTTGAHTNLIEKRMPTQANMPIVLRWTPTWRSHADSVEYTR